MTKGSGIKQLRLNGTAGNVQMFVTRATTSTNYLTNTTPLSSLGVWRFVATTFNSAAGAGEIVNIYTGGLTSAAVEATYSVATDGADALTTDATPNLIGGNSNTTSAFQGDIAWVGVWNRVLTLGEIRGLQFLPRKTSGCLLLSHYGWQGTGTQVDYSGNAASGTVSGATLATAGLPLPSPFSGDEWGLVVPASAAAPPASRRQFALLGVG